MDDEPTGCLATFSLRNCDKYKIEAIAGEDVMRGMDDEYELICVLIAMHGEVVPGDEGTNMLNTTQSN